MTLRMVLFLGGESRDEKERQFWYNSRMRKDILPSDYEAFLQSIKTRVQQAQFQALIAVNKELIFLYWHIGRGILERQEKQGWGTGVIGQLSHDLHAAFPQMKGFSLRNLGYMKAFALAYPDEQILQEVLAKLTWYHHIALLEKVKDENERLWYMQKTIEHGWSRNVLVHQINTGLYQRKGKAITNFQSTLPALQSDLANDVLKDPYISGPRSRSPHLTPCCIRCRYAHIEAQTLLLSL